METGILALTYPKAWQKNKGIMTPETGNYWQLYRHWRNGDIIFKDLDIQQLSYLIMIIFDTSKSHKPLDDEWRDGLYICPNLISNWCTFQGKGIYRAQADSLSWRPDLCPQGTDNEDVIVLPEHLFVNLIDMELQKKIANAKNMDYDAAEAIKELLEQGPREAKKDLMDWEEFEGENVLFYKEKNYVPINAELRREIVRRYHNHLTAGHPGELQTFNAVKEHYWWPGLRVFIKNYVQGCGTCQQFKIDRNPSKPAFVPIKGAK
jgi:Integrase zinc binding domain